jgi:hypothetical protein
MPLTSIGSPFAKAISDSKSHVWTVPDWQEKKGGALQDRSVQSYWSLAARLKNELAAAKLESFLLSPYSAKNIEEFRNWCCSADTSHGQSCQAHGALVADASMRGLRTVGRRDSRDAFEEDQ